MDLPKSFATTLPYNIPPFLRPYIIEHSKNHGRLLEKEAIRARSFSARDLLTLVATGGQSDYRGLADAFEHVSDNTLPLQDLALQHFDLKSALALARVLTAQQLFLSDKFVAKRIYDLVHSFSEGEFASRDWINYVGVLTDSGLHAQAARVLDGSPLQSREPYEYACLLANILAADTSIQCLGSRWLDTINGTFLRDGLEPIEVAHGSAPLIDRLVCEVKRPSVDGPLVSVLMTHYGVGDAILTAISSVLNQSWRNIELILVDDCSPPNEYETIAKLSDLDPRLKVYRTDSNSGTYTARNLGLTHAKGEFITCHDADDWSHPRKIERQVTDLLATGGVANLSQWTRVSENLTFHRFSASGKYIYPNTSSLMFKREPVVSHLGGWDPVRSGADTEFYKRIEIVFGCKLAVLPGAPLSFGRTRPNALTSGTLGLGWSSAARRHYRSAWMHWHHAIKSSRAEAKLGKNERRKFPAPGSILPREPDRINRNVNIVIASDLRQRRVAHEIAREVKALTDSAFSVALCHVSSMKSTVAGREQFDREIQTLFQETSARQIELDEALECDLLVIRDPAALQFVDSRNCTIRPERVVILTEDQPSTKASRAQSYSIAAVDAAVARIFGRRADWASTNLAIRERIKEIVGPAALLTGASLRLPDLDAHTATGAREHAAAPVIGQYFASPNSRWKDWGLCDERLFPSSGIAVRIAGGRRADDFHRPDWEIFPCGQVRAVEFFLAVRFVPYFPSRDDDRCINSTLAAALLAGCVVLTEPGFEHLLGQAAVYVDKDSVPSVITWLNADPSALSAQSLRAQTFAEEKLVPEAYVEYLGHLVRR